jgi:protein tyrosine phosphatase (PTP) superfamily phosphohydrolase (DUF442 family)
MRLFSRLTTNAAAVAIALAFMLGAFAAPLQAKGSSASESAAKAAASGSAATKAAARQTASNGASNVTAPDVDGVTHFRRLGTTIACGGATSPAAVAEIRKMGFVADINFRVPSEPGANVEGEGAAAKAAGLRYYNIPFDGEHPSDAAVTKFLRVITARGNQPAYIHCSGGNRAATMWFIKRMVVDHWNEERAWNEASELGMKSLELKKFGVEYARTHKAPKRLM